MLYNSLIQQQLQGLNGFGNGNGNGNGNGSGMS